MTPPTQTLKALGERLARRPKAWRNRLRAGQSRLGGAPEIAERLPEPVLLGDAGRGQALVGGSWQALGRTLALGPSTIWQVQVPDPRLERERQVFQWLDDLAALGN